MATIIQHLLNNGSLESQTRDYFGAVEAFTFWKGRVALFSALKALNIGVGDAVMMAGYTCAVVPAAVKALQSKPLYVDIDPRSYNLNPILLEKLWQPDVKALIVQHTYGIPAEMDSIMAWADDKGIPIIEDCCHTFGTAYRNRLVGTFGIAAFLSTQWSKPFTTGLGGLLIVHSRELSEKVALVIKNAAKPSMLDISLLGIQWLLHKAFVFPRTHARARSLYRKLSTHNIMIGSSAKGELRGSKPHDYLKRMSRLQSFIGERELQRLDSMNDHRRALAQFYENELHRIGFSYVQLKPWEDAIFLCYPVRVGNKSELLRKASKHGIELGSWFECPLHPIETSMSAFGYRSGLCPIAERIASEVINLPTHCRVSWRQAERTIEFLARYALPADKFSNEIRQFTTDFGLMPEFLYAESV